MRAKASVPSEKLWQQDAIKRNAVENDVMQRQIEPVLSVGQADKSEAIHRTPCEIEWLVHIVGREPKRFFLRICMAAQVDEWDFDAVGRSLDNLDGLIFLVFKDGSPRFVPPHNLEETAFQRRNVQLAPSMNRDRLVIYEVAAGQLRVQPHLLLAVGEWQRASNLFASEWWLVSFLFGRLRREDIAPGEHAAPGKACLSLSR